MATVEIKLIECVDTTTGPGDDEIFYDTIVDGSNTTRYPSSSTEKMGDSSKWKPDQSYPFSNSFEFQLWEEDSVTQNDKIGSFSLTTSSATGQHTKTLDGDGGTYKVTYDLSA